MLFYLTISMLCLTWMTLLYTHTHTAPTSPQFVSQPSNKTAAPSSMITLECSASGNPQPSITWYKDRLPLTLDSHRQQNAGSGSLSISNLQNSDVGQYHCVASNTAGSVASLTATLQLACKCMNDVWQTRVRVLRQWNMNAMPEV